MCVCVCVLFHYPDKKNYKITRKNARKKFILQKNPLTTSLINLNFITKHDGKFQNILFIARKWKNLFTQIHLHLWFSPVSAIFFIDFPVSRRCLKYTKSSPRSLNFNSQFQLSTKLFLYPFPCYLSSRPFSLLSSILVLISLTLI